MDNTLETMLPMQAAPVDRMRGAASLTSDSGVEPAFLGSIGSALLPIATDLAGRAGQSLIERYL